MNTIVVIGGGAAGMMAAYFAAKGGARVRLLEKNEKLGKKLYITGKGRCNVTNTADAERFMRSVVRNPRFTYAALAYLDNAALMALIEAHGTPLKVERGDRVYPVSEHASDVTKALERAMLEAGVTVRINATVSALDMEGGAVRGVVLAGGERIPADAVIVATGGLSYPSTGSTGDGYAFARSAGIAVTPTRPSLTGIETVETWPFALSGLTLKNVRLRAGAGKKKFFDEQGELLLTHFGISGPLALTLSSMLPDDYVGVPLSLDLKPGLDVQALDRRLQRDFEVMIRRRLGAVMDGLEPHNLGQALLEVGGFAPGEPVNEITRARRQQLAAYLKDVPLTVAGLRGYQEAVITRGGVDVRAINPSTMAVKGVPGLYFAGEALDIDALTGGYNLQLAFSTGALAGARAAEAVNG